MRVLLTGATGFVGRNLLKHLEQQACEVLTIGRDDSPVDIDLKMKTFRPDVVVHLATFFRAEHASEDVATLVQSNILFGTQVVEAMVRNDIHNLVNTGTLWQYFEGERDVASCLYAATKTAFEDVLKYYCSAFDLQVINLMLSDTFGAGDPRPKLLPKLMSIAGTEEQLSLSKGEQILEWTYISDIVKAYWIAMTRLCEGRELKSFVKYTVTSGEAHSLRESVKILEQVMGKEIHVDFGARPYRKREVMSLVKLDPALPDWKPLVSFREGVEMCLRG